MINIQKSWYKPFSLCSLLLLPLTMLYRGLMALRRVYYHRYHVSPRFHVPVIVVGNINVGGTGKTPLVQWLCQQLQQQGYHPGIVSRGYGSQAKQFPVVISAATSVTDSGDEPYLHFLKTQCPVVIAPERNQAIQTLLSQFECDLVISDDGLQHLKMFRDIEIVVVDGARQFGNGFCLPSGPLREPISRLKTVDCVVQNGGDTLISEQAYRMSLVNQFAYKLNAPSITKQLADFAQKTVHAVAGIGYTERFFMALEQFDIKVIAHPLADHAPIQVTDLQFMDEFPIFITEKDAVKCRSLTLSAQIWVVPVAPILPPEFLKRILTLLKTGENCEH